jgi:protein-S-isoprenylcysteine O-methyltransferase Ste14
MTQHERSWIRSLGLAFRSLLWALLLPGLFAGYIPWRYFGLRSIVLDLDQPLHWIGLLGIVVGTLLLAACILEFARSGRGTLSPVDPPRTLVIRGPYRYVRNPMYLGVSLILLGEVVLTRSGGLFGWWAAWFVMVNLFVLLYEEPTLRDEFGAAYTEYTAAVGRWLPRLRPWPG